MPNTCNTRVVQCNVRQSARKCTKVHPRLSIAQGIASATVLYLVYRFRLK